MFRRLLKKGSKGGRATIKIQGAPSRGISFLMSVAMLFVLGACVSKQRYQEQVDRSNALARQLAKEQARRMTLEEDIAVLKEHIHALELETEAAASDIKREDLKKGFQALKEALWLAEEMGGEIEKGLRGNVRALKKRYEKTLKETKKEIARFKGRLKNDEDLKRLRIEIRRQVASLLSLIEEIDEMAEQ